ncbi:hypothetical protein [Pseudoteredinibacter isoporae]|uniref:hypothetical protein n=1 Tax=Pseudoteredinibacter isoporae TaxID=570281 RepID=UPI0031055361
MKDEKYNYSIMIGSSRRKVEPLNMVLGKPFCRDEDNDWVVECAISGFYSESKKVEGRSAFDCLICGMAYFRQSLRFIKLNNQKLKLFFEFEKNLDEITIDDVFMTHDCITDEMEEMIQWAIESGFKSE